MTKKKEPQMKHKTIKIIAILSILLGAGYALAFQGGCPKNMPENCDRDCMATDMIPDLTEEQKTTINTLKETFNNDSNALRDQIREKHMELKTLMQGDPLDKDAIYAKQEEISALKEKLQKLSLTFQVGVAEVLTPEQRKVAGPGACPGQGGCGACPGMGKGFHQGKQGKGMGGKTRCPAMQNES